MSTPTLKRASGRGAIAREDRVDPRIWPRCLRVVGAGLLFGSGAIHLDLWITGYRSIPTIGALFLLQVISAFVLATLVLLTGRRLVALAGAGLAISTLGGYLVSLRVDLLGFREVRTTAGIVSGAVEIAAFATLATLALLPPVVSTGSRRARGLGAAVSPYLPAARWAAGGVTVLATVLLVLAVRASPPTPTGTSSGRTRLDARSIAGTDVVTNAQGRTLYWFDPDTPTTSACNGTCAVYWPPVTGTPSAGAGVPGTLGTIHRSDGTTQATYDGHPLYTYIGDNGPGQAHGNDVTLNGGVWHEMAASG